MLHNKSENEVKRNIAITRAQFVSLHESLPSLRESFKSEQNSAIALYIYLMKLRTAIPNEDIGLAFGISRTTTDRAIRLARASMEKDFLFENVNFEQSHEDVASHNTTMSRILFCNGETSKAVLICDGTYIFANKSRNYEFQRLTYSGQKKRNFLKTMMVVAPNGKILYALGPYSSHDNDAKILQMIAESTTAFDNFRNDETVIILDRGFRDCVTFFENEGFEVMMPALLQKSKNKQQLSTLDANNSRLVTAIRFIVETINGHMKVIWKIFTHEWNPQAIPHVVIDFQICAGLRNRFFSTFESNKDNATEIAQQMVERVNKKNELADTVLSDQFNRNLKKSFIAFRNFDDLPELTLMDLTFISLGKYQIKQAESYSQEHIKDNDSSFAVFTLPDEMCYQLFEDHYTSGKHPILLLAQIKSRFRSKKYYNAYILVDRNGAGKDAVLSYCCECYVGLRTVGCCSHVMTLIWFTLHKKNRQVPAPASFLNNYFNLHENAELSAEENLEENED